MNADVNPWKDQGIRIKNGMQAEKTKIEKKNPRPVLSVDSI